MMQKARIIFMGTPDFAVPTLNILLQQEDLEVVAVITAPDKPGGRGRKTLLESAVKKVALQHQINILQPINLKNEDFIRTYRELDADLAVVVAFRMLPEVIWSAPRLGTINLHASLLPAYRGAAPINWAIINGEKKTGLTTFLIAKEIDTGGVIYQKEIYIDENETAGSLHDRMMDIGAELVVDTVHTMLSEQAKYLEQDDSKATKAPKIFTEDCEIQKEWPARKIYNFIRGLSPFPGAWIQIGSDVVKIVWSTYNQTPLPYNSGTILSDGKSYLRLCTIDGYVDFEELQMPGKKRMNIKAFLNGFDINRWENDVLQIS